MSRELVFTCPFRGELLQVPIRRKSTPIAEKKAMVPATMSQKRRALMASAERAFGLDMRLATARRAPAPAPLV